MEAMVVRLGNAIHTVTVRDAVECVHPPDPTMVYKIFEVPAAIAVTNPVTVFTLATAGLLLLQLPPVTVEV